MSNEELENMQALCDGATAGPWQATTSWPAYVSFPLHDNLHQKIMDEVYDSADASFIAAARQFIPKAIEALQEQQQEIESYHDLTTRQANLLTSVVNTLRGTPPPLTLWPHHDAPDLAQKLKDQTEALQASTPRWIAVEERLPEDNGPDYWNNRVLIVRPPDYYVKTAYMDNGGWYVEGEDYDGDALLDNTVTHWQPLPKPPTTLSTTSHALPATLHPEN